ncbi:MAG: HAMP domain-containing histidine kinase [Phycisphaerales bacterium]|nr:HAMP domain-containing histidine kinase [Phycisphaerales bacterium]
MPAPTSHPASGQPARRRKPAFSLRARLTLWVVCIFTVIQWSTSVVFWLYQGASINRVFDEHLAASARKIMDEVAPALPFIEAEELNRTAAIELRLIEFERLVIDVFDAEGSCIVMGRKPYIQPEDIPASRILTSSAPHFAHITIPALSDERGEAGEARVVFLAVRPSDQDQYILAVATSDTFAARQRALVGQVLLIAAFIGPLAAAVSGWFIGGIAVEPFARLGALARGLAPESIDERLAIDSSHAEVARLTSELEEARQRLQQGFASQERFLSNVSHELKTPIAVMIAQAQTLDRSGLPRPVDEFIGSTTEEMLRLGQLVESFLTLTRVRDGVGASRVSRLTANDLVLDSIRHCMSMADQYGVRLAPHLLEEPSLDAEVIGDPDLMRTMVDNLLRNAIRFSPQDRPIEIRMHADDAQITITVRDFGPGIPPDRIETIFDRFAQAESEQRKGRGHGLGLAIAQGIAELHQGSISVHNCEHGCAFVITLPRHDLAAAADESESASQSE